jgi:TRAP transporter 4TM/12TM fusion protein
MHNRKQDVSIEKKSSEKDLFEHMRETSLKLPSQQKNVCDYILAHYQQAAFMKAEEVALATKTSNATVIRTAGSLGFKSYTEMKEEIQHVLTSTTPPPLDRLRKNIAGDSGLNVLDHVIITNSFRKATRLSFKSFLRALDLGARGALSVIAACAVAGLIVGTVTLTGLGLKFADFIIVLSGGSLYLALFLTMIASLIMGMGMPTTALYIILGSMVAPALVKLNIPVVAAHLFIFYFGCMASVTPPVALSSYLAAAIARADSVKTALQGLKLSSSAFILPFVFALSPRILLLDTTVGAAIMATVTATLGVMALSACLEGYFMGNLSLFVRVVAGVAAIFLIDPGWKGDIVGLVLLSAIIFLQVNARKKKRDLKGEVDPLE